jgi:hypothetical protein
MSEIKNIGVELVKALCCIADVLKAADYGNYTGNTGLTIDLAEHPERHLKTMYELLASQRRNGIFNVSVFPAKAVLHTIFYPPRPRHCGVPHLWRK